MCHSAVAAAATCLAPPTHTTATSCSRNTWHRPRFGLTQVNRLIFNIARPLSANDHPSISLANMRHPNAMPSQPVKMLSWACCLPPTFESVPLTSPTHDVPHPAPTLPPTPRGHPAHAQCQSEPRRPVWSLSAWDM